MDQLRFPVVTLGRLRLRRQLPKSLLCAAKMGFSAVIDLAISALVVLVGLWILMRLAEWYQTLN